MGEKKKNGSRLKSGEENRQFFMPTLLSVSPAPHISALDTVRTVMLDVIIALIPALAWGIYKGGLNAFLIVIISVATCVLSEFVFQKITRRTVTVTDLSAVVTGLILAMLLPAECALYVPCIGGVFAIIVVKQLFGGIGRNIVNPALAARAFIALCWPAQLIKFTGGAAQTTALDTLNSGAIPKVSLFNCIIGNVPGSIGEVSAIALLIGFVYLLVRRVVSWQLPVGFVFTVALVSFAFPLTDGSNIDFMLYSIFSGSLLICALICANDYATSPVTGSGRLIFGVGAGLITVFIRYFGASTEGAVYGILIMNLLVPFIERLTAPRRFGRPTKARL